MAAPTDNVTASDEPQLEFEINVDPNDARFKGDDPKLIPSKINVKAYSEGRFDVTVYYPDRGKYFSLTLNEIWLVGSLIPITAELIREHTSKKSSGASDKGGTAGVVDSTGGKREAPEG